MQMQIGRGFQRENKGVLCKREEREIFDPLNRWKGKSFIALRVLSGDGTTRSGIIGERLEE